MKRALALASVLALASSALAQEAGLARSLSERNRAALERARSVVVAVEVQRPAAPEGAQAPPQGMNRWLQMFNNTGPYTERPAGPVPGTIVDADGWVATTYFNVRDATSDDVRVRLSDGTWTPGRIVGFDAALDIAMIRTEARSLPTLEAASMEHVVDGQAVLVLGLSPDDFEPNLTQGMVSAPERFWGFCLGHDARVNWSNLGGPLVDLDGRLLGMTCQVNSESINTSGMASGVSFAIAVDRLLRERETLATGRRNVGAFIGIQGETVDEGGVRVRRIIPNTGAATAGLRANDIVLSIDGEFVQTMEQVRLHVLRKNPGEHIAMRIRRGEEEMDLDIELSARPEP